CPTCGRLRPASDFTKSSRTKDGLYWECKSCKSERSRRDYAQHKEKRLQKAREWKEQNPELVKAATDRYKPRRRSRERERREEERRRRIQEQGLVPWSIPSKATETTD